MPPRKQKLESDDTGQDELTCPICHEHFCFPVTLSCGHTFDRACLEAFLRSGQKPAGGWDETDGSPSKGMFHCPMDRKPVALPLPEVNVTLRALAKRRFPHEIDIREAELRIRRRDARPTTGMRRLSWATNVMLQEPKQSIFVCLAAMAACHLVVLLWRALRFSGSTPSEPSATS
eukprot:gnl/TRDRNA2_/TRDRNA2_69997_c0_seq1.p1 gnl/TRDRNA2_/TRDRNA2_69997_c0~~gnl/TRDRNA2_/TRDRNA2_69997_c0_seq1.p1  ORF type:complete len:175 (-),score=25.25 gnl/TRDRNA2_/TRDRNA2_69997_c0_seq1:46-570(-)